MDTPKNTICRFKLLHGISLDHNLAKKVRELSALYLSEDPKRFAIWDDPQYRAAYLAYFMPRNLLRLEFVLQEASRLNFFEGFTHVCEIGSGPGTFQMAAQEWLKSVRWSFVEKNKSAQELHRKWLGSRELPRCEWVDAPNPKAHLVVLSFSYNELESFEVPKSEGLLLVEPGSRREGRGLLDLRQKLIKSGFHIWAPCTHQSECPLLLHSKKDWCHQRIKGAWPEPLARFFSILPMNAEDLSLSYFLARRTPPPHQLLGKTRITGELKKEKGKAKQSICRSSKKEFLSFLDRHAPHPVYEQGALISLPEGVSSHGNELRIKY